MWSKLIEQKLNAEDETTQDVSEIPQMLVNRNQVKIQEQFLRFIQIDEYIET